MNYGNNVEVERTLSCPEQLYGCSPVSAAEDVAIVKSTSTEVELESHCTLNNNWNTSHLP